MKLSFDMFFACFRKKVVRLLIHNFNNLQRSFKTGTSQISVWPSYTLYIYGEGSLKEFHTMFS